MKRVLFVLIVSALPIYQALAQSGVNNDTQQAIENTQRFMQELERLEEAMPAKLTAQAEERKRKEAIERQRLVQEAEQRKRQEAIEQHRIIIDGKPEINQPRMSWQKKPAL